MSNSNLRLNKILTILFLILLNEEEFFKILICDKHLSMLSLYKLINLYKQHLNL